MANELKYPDEVKVNHVKYQIINTWKYSNGLYRICTIHSGRITLPGS